MGAFYFNFETISAALLSSFELLSGENWPAYMTRFLYAARQDGNNATAPLRTVGSNVQSSVAAYFSLSQLLLNSIAAELFITSVVVLYFERHKESMGLGVLNDYQKMLVENTRRLMLVKPSVRIRELPLVACGVAAGPQWNNARRQLFSVMQAPLYLHLITILVLANLGQMMAYRGKDAGQPPSTVAALNTADKFFTWAFFGEALLRYLRWASGSTCGRKSWMPSLPLAAWRRSLRSSLARQAPLRACRANCCASPASCASRASCGR